jgi:heptosyltransferase-3
MPSASDGPNCTGEGDRRERRGGSLQHTLDRVIGIPLIFLLAAFRRRQLPPVNVRAIGLICLGAIGDTVLLTAVIADIRQALPEARIVLVISRSNRAITPLLPNIDQFIVLPILRPLDCINTLRSVGLDVLVDFTQWPRISAIYAALAGARFTAGFKVLGQYRDRAFDRVVEHSASCHELENFRALIRAVGVPTSKLPSIEIPAAAFMSVAGKLDVPFVVFHPWASGFKGWLREWTIEGYVDLARAVTAWGYQVIVTGSPDDIEKSAALVARGRLAGVSITSMAGRLSLAEVAALLSQARLVVSVSTGIAHLAAALDAPQVALYGPTNPLLWRPVSDRSTVIVPTGVPTGYLYLGFEYPKNPVNSLDFILPADVIVAARQMLGARQTLAPQELSDAQISERADGTL